ncbi:MAG TPA: hypothetical protein VEB63_05360 [Chitinophagaceae bacterium]|nr:hypothetical protein [Chitinophagaceae bacterium]
MRSFHQSLPAVVCLLLLFSCSKAPLTEKSFAPHGYSFVKYSIPAGQHYASSSVYRPIDLQDLRFIVKFDSSAVYQTQDPSNQEDINKLYGFSDNGAHHHQYSARFGWNWVRNALRLYGYVYNNGQRMHQEITPIEIGREYYCSLRVTSDKYIFTVNSIVAELPRSSGSARAQGYQLFPYFGGDEPAPHQIDIWIRDL